MLVLVADCVHLPLGLARNRFLVITGHHLSGLFFGKNLVEWSEPRQRS
jgi:hypothetical protein